MSERPRVLDQLGLELERVARKNLAQKGGLRFAPRRLSAAVVLVILLAFAAAATAAILITEGSPLPPPHAQDLRSNGVPLPGSAHLAGLDAPDPDPSAPRWDIRLSRTRAGETCTAVGQVLDGQFGIVGLDHVFRALPLGGVDACGVNSPDGPILAGARVLVGVDPQEARTVINGVAGDGARSVTAYGPGGPRALALGAHGSFITVYRGFVEELRPRVVVVTRDGVSHTIAFAQSSAFEVSDPAGGSPWQVSGEADLQPGASPDENCAQVTQEPGRGNPSPIDTSLTPEVCGRLGKQPLFVLMRRFVAGSGQGSGWPWGNNPARTLVYGAAAPRVASLTLTGAGAARALSIDPRGGVFVAVLDGHVDPRSLALTAQLRDGRRLTYTRTSNLLGYQSNRPLPEPPVPAYRNPLPASMALPPPFEIPLRGTVREALRARDPAGAGTWVLRSWRGRPNPHANFGGEAHPERFICIEVGLARGSTLVEPRVNAPAQPLSVGGESGRCNQPRDLTRMVYMLQVESFLADPYSYEPRPLRTVLSGELPPAATDPVLLGVGSPRPLPLDPNHAFLVVVPGHYWSASPHITYKLRGLTVGGGRAPLFPLGPGPATPQARAADPNGGAPWGFAASNNSSAYGRIVDGRLAGIDEQNGTLQNGPEGSSSGGTAPIRRKLPPVRFDTQGGPEFNPLGQPTTAPPSPEVERRTLPGRTIITGTADADVVSVTLATPRDVRTLRPSGPAHAFIVVYDGQFFRAALTATVELRDGRTVTEQVPNGPGGLAGSTPPTPSLASRLHEAKRQLQQEREHPHRLPRFAPAAPSLALMIRVIARRMAYERAHPGALPAE